MEVKTTTNKMYLRGGYKDWLTQNGAELDDTVFVNWDHQQSCLILTLVKKGHNFDGYGDQDVEEEFQGFTNEDLEILFRDNVEPGGQDANVVQEAEQEFDLDGFMENFQGFDETVDDLENS